MSDLNPETLSADDVRALAKERDLLLKEVAHLALTIERTTARVELLKEAAYQALEYLTTPNPYTEPARQRLRAILRMEDALAVNGCGVVRFDIRSDAN